MAQQCTTYNNTFVHRGFSFEHALLDSILQLQEGAPHTLTGALDEMSEEHFYIKSRIGHWKKEPVDNADLYKTPSPGTIAGGGCFLFIVFHRYRSYLRPHCRAKNVVQAFSCCSFGRAKALFLGKGNSNYLPADISLVIIGRNGDSNFEHFYRELDAVLRLIPPTKTAIWNIFSVSMKLPELLPFGWRLIL